MRRLIAVLVAVLLIPTVAGSALTVSQVNGYPITTGGGKVETVATVTFDSSYATGGESLTAATMGMYAIDWLTVDAPDTVAIGNGTFLYSFIYDYTNAKLLAFCPDDSTGITVDGGAGGDSSYIFLTRQVPSGRDLSGCSVRVRATGYGM